MNENVRKRGGQKLYGGRDGDDMFTILFPDAGPALQCAQDIKKDFEEDLFLQRSGDDIKFGLCFTVFSSEKKEYQIIQSWGSAKDCCEFKSTAYRNRGHLLTSSESIQNMKMSNLSDLLEKFEILADVTLKSGEQVYKYIPIKPFKS